MPINAESWDEAFEEKIKSIGQFVKSKLCYYNLTKTTFETKEIAIPLAEIIAIQKKLTCSGFLLAILGLGGVYYLFYLDHVWWSILLFFMLSGITSFLYPMEKIKITTIKGAFTVKAGFAYMDELMKELTEALRIFRSA